MLRVIFFLSAWGFISYACARTAEYASLPTHPEAGDHRGMEPEMMRLSADTPPSDEEREELLLNRSGLFDEMYYLAQNIDVAELPVPPVVHFLVVGWCLPMRINPWLPAKIMYEVMAEGNRRARFFAMLEDVTACYAHINDESFFAAVRGDVLRRLAAADGT